MNRCFALMIVGLLAGFWRAQADEPDDQYILIYNLIQEADTLSRNAAPAQALEKYQDAETALKKFQRRFPDWNPKVLNFRLNYLAAQTAALAALVPASGATNWPPAAKALSPEKPLAGALEKEINSLKNQIIQYQQSLRTYEAQSNRMKADQGLLEAKLKEALAARPAALDPRQLAQAEERIKALQKETDLLRVSLEQAKSRPARSAADAKVLVQAQQALAEANRNLVEQTDKADKLAQDKRFLQSKLALLSPGSENAPALEAARKALQEANRQLAQQKELASQLASEKEALQSRVKTLSGEGEAAAALRAENALLKKQLAGLKAVPLPAPKAVKTSRRLAQAQAQIAALQSDKDILRLEKIALENRLQQLSASAATNAVVAAPGKPEEAARIKELEHQRDDLQQKLAAATQELSRSQSQAPAAPIAEMENQMAALRARLDVFEARRVPFTAEELALFTKPQAKPAETGSASATQSTPALPAGTAALAAQAQRYFSAGKLDEAEATYVKVLRQDQTNVFTLANLAAVQLERNRLGDAERNIRQALALAPDDAYSLSILGYLKYRQQQYDEALEALSRAAKLDPQSAQIQNYLGTTLAEKGLRGPAETAFRKAIEIDPQYGDAHLNLAVIYLSEQPPLVELARWHYQKARAAGHAPDPYLEKKLETRQ